MSEGKWIKLNDKRLNLLELLEYRCSCCGNIVVFKKFSPFESISEYKYCFNCGAKMGVEK